LVSQGINILQVLLKDVLNQISFASNPLTINHIKKRPQTATGCNIENFYSACDLLSIMPF